MATKNKKTKEESKKIEVSLFGKPRVTEKASMNAEKNIYTFNVEGGINKTEIKKAIFALYKVHPVKVNVLNIPRKISMFKGQKGMRGGGRKAVIYLKKGDKIEIV